MRFVTMCARGVRQVFGKCGKCVLGRRVGRRRGDRRRCSGARSGTGGGLRLSGARKVTKHAGHPTASGGGLSLAVSVREQKDGKLPFMY